MNDVAVAFDVQRLTLEPREHRALASAGQASLVYVVDGVLKTDHPVAALRRVLRGEFVLFPGHADTRLTNGSSRDPLSVVTVGGLPVAPADRPVSRYYSDDDKAGRLCLAASARGRDGSLAVGRPVLVYVTRLAARDTIVFEPESANAVAFLLSGAAMVNRTALEPHRMHRIKEGGSVRLASDSAAHVLVLDFPEDDQ
ncbi:MAG: hypothetical protein AAFU65_16555 [Pseudomonadota bacterium]